MDGGLIMPELSNYSEELEIRTADGDGLQAGEHTEEVVIETGDILDTSNGLASGGSIYITAGKGKSDALYGGSIYLSAGNHGAAVYPIGTNGIYENSNAIVVCHDGLATRGHFIFGNDTGTTNTPDEFEQENILAFPNNTVQVGRMDDLAATMGWTVGTNGFLPVFFERSVAPTTGTIASVTGSSNNARGTRTWTNPTFTAAAPATVTFTATDQETQYLKLVAWNLGIVASKIVTGIKVIINAQASSGDIRLVEARLYIRGVLAGANGAGLAMARNVSPVTVGDNNNLLAVDSGSANDLTIGAADDLWKADPVVHDLNAADFGVALCFRRFDSDGGTTTLTVNSVDLKAYTFDTDS